MRRFIRWYGAHPLHLLTLAGSFAVAGYAAVRLISSRPVAVIVWFVVAAVAHDLVLLPLYGIVDWSASRVWRRESPRFPVVAWTNYLRWPAALSGLLLLIWFPSILRLSQIYGVTTDLSAARYLSHWLLITAALFFVSATAFAIRLRQARRRAS